MPVITFRHPDLRQPTRQLRGSAGKGGKGFESGGKRGIGRFDLAPLPSARSIGPERRLEIVAERHDLRIDPRGIIGAS
ncbi:MAG: hypothetical protein ACXW3R_16550, partial [Rhodoplanes sp.]